MRDRINQNQAQFNIQLEETVKKNLSSYDKFLTRPVFVSPTLLNTENFHLIEERISYPREFRLLRTLSIVQWYFPEELHWRVHLDLENFSFSWLNREQKVELSILLSSKENMKKFLFETEFCTSNEIFGNIIGNDLKDLFKVFKISQKKIFNFGPIRVPIRRRGYKDKGSRRPSHKWIETSDFSFTDYQNQLEEERKLTHDLIQQLLSSLNSEERELFHKLEKILHSKF